IALGSRLRRNTGARQRLGAGSGKRHLFIFDCRLAVCDLHWWQRRHRLLLLLHDLDAHQLSGNSLAQALAHVLEQIESLGLVFIEWIALAIAAEADDLAKMLEHDEMFAPEMIERL